MSERKDTIRRHVAIKREIDAELTKKKKQRDRDRSWLVNYYLKLGMDAERAA